MLTCCMVVFRYSDIEEIVLKIIKQCQNYKLLSILKALLPLPDVHVKLITAFEIDTD